MADDMLLIEAGDDDFDAFEVVDEAYEARLLDEAEAEIAAGRFVSNTLVSEWLSRVGTERETPMPSEWLR